jgi:inosine/xanthosine triphosphatase
MARVIVASTNPVKIKAVTRGFEQMFPGEHLTVEGIGFDSPVNAQPFGDEETLHGAASRARMARDLVPDADYWVGVEGGVTASRTDMQAFAWIYVQSDAGTGQARSASFPLPVKIAELVMDGIELGEADDIVFGRTNSKQANGAVGILTADAVDRQALYEQPVILALIPFKNPGLFGIG